MNANDFSRLFDIIEKHEQYSADKPLIIAIDGGSASGKTTLARALSEKYDCNVFHADDFFLRSEQRTFERLSEIGGNLDRERFYTEVLEPLIKGKSVTYQRFNCSNQALEAPTTVSTKRINIVEGAYSMHVDFGRYYHLSVFLDIEPEYQRERILTRNSQGLATRFFEEWIPMENRYFLATDIKNRADMVFRIEK